MKVRGENIESHFMIDQVGEILITAVRCLASSEAREMVEKII